MKRKGALSDLFILAIVAFIAVAFFALWTYGHGMITDTLLQAGAKDTSSANITQATNIAFGYTDNALPILRWMSFGMIIAMMLAIVLSNFLVRAHPAFFIIYVLITLVAVIFGAYLSNAYESLVNNPTFGATIQTFGASNHILLNLPIYMSVIGILGAIALFINLRTSPDIGGVL